MWVKTDESACAHVLFVKDANPQQKISKEAEVKAQDALKYERFCPNRYTSDLT
jgi:hypothetical protein